MEMEKDNDYYITICILQRQSSSSEAAGGKSSFKKVNEALKDWMDDEKDELLKSNKELKAEMSRKREENESLAKSKQELQSHLTKHEEEHIKLKEDIAKERERLNTEFTKMRQHNKQLKSEVTSLKEENDEKEGVEKCNDALQAEMSKLGEENDNLSKCNEDLTSEVARLKEVQKADSVKLKLRGEAQEEISKCNEELKSRVAESQKKFDGVSDTLKRTIDQKHVFENKICEMKEEYDDICARLKSEVNEKEAKTQRNAELQRALDVVTSKLELMDKEKKAMAQHNEELEGDMMKVIDKYEAISAKLNHELNENEAIAKHNEKLQDESTTLKAECDAVSAKLRHITNEKEATTTELEKVVSDKQVALEMLMKLKDKFRDQSEALMCEKSKLKIALDASESRLEQRETSERGKDREIVNLRQQLQTMAEARNEEFESKLAQAPSSLSSSFRDQSKAQTARRTGRRATAAELEKVVADRQVKLELLMKLKSRVEQREAAERGKDRKIADLPQQLQIQAQSPNKAEVRNEEFERKLAHDPSSSSSSLGDVDLRDNLTRKRAVLGRISNNGPGTSSSSSSRSTAPASRDLRDIMRAQRACPSAQGSDLTWEEEETIDLGTTYVGEDGLRRTPGAVCGFCDAQGHIAAHCNKKRMAVNLGAGAVSANARGIKRSRKSL